MKKILRDYINYNQTKLENSDKTLKDIYDLMFRCKDQIIAETYENFRIRQYTYKEVDSWIEKSAAALYSIIGATHKYVAIEMENDIRWIVTFWAVLKSGNKPYLVNCRHPENLSQELIDYLDIEYVIGLSETKLNAKYIDFSEFGKKTTSSALDAKAPQAQGEDFSPVDRELFENEIALSTSATSMHGVICFYSGSEISNQILNAKDILSHSKRMAYHYKGYLKQLAFLPFYHVFGLFAVYFWFIFFGRTLVFLNDYSPKTILNTCRRHNVTHIFAVPMLWHTIEKELNDEIKKQGEKKRRKFEKGIKICTKLQDIAPFIGARLSQKIMREVTDNLFGQSIGFCISGGSYLKDSALKTINGIGYPLHNGYGMSEVGITSVELRKKACERNQNSVGRPFSSVEYKISNRGTLMIRGKSICKKMITDGKLTENTGWFDSGDIARCVDGNFYIIGRSSDIVITENGENINPDVLEKAFDIPYANRFSVLGLEFEKPTANNKNDLENMQKNQACDCISDERLSMVVEISKALNSSQISKIKNYIESKNRNLPVSFQITDFYFTYDEIAAQTAIKVGRPYLQKGIANGNIKLIPFSNFTVCKDENFETPSMSQSTSQQKEKIRKIIADALKKSPDEIKDQSHIIHDLGATSLEYFAVIMDIAETFKIESFDEKEQYCYTVDEFCDYLERHKR